MSRLILIVVTLLLGVLALYGQRDTAYAVTNTDQRWLTYYTIVNQFDSASFMAKYGELTYRHGETKVRLKPTSTIPLNQWTHDTSSGIEQVGVSQSLRWQTLTLHAGATLTFFRSASLKACCAASSSNPSGQVQDPSIQDLTISVLELCDVNTHERVVVLDSIRLDSGMASAVGGFSGTEPDSTLRTVVIPASAHGRTVYPRIRAMRYGHTPFGLSFTRDFAAYNLSFFYKSRTQRATRSEHVYHDSVRFARFLDYADAYVRAFCVFPSIQGFAFEPAQSRKIQARYFVPLRVKGVDTVFALKPCVPDACDSPKAQYQAPQTAGAVPRVASARSSPGEMLITVQGTTVGQHIAATIYALDGRIVGESAYIIATGALQVVNVQIRPETASGAYFCRIHGSDGATICTASIWY